MSSREEKCTSARGFSVVLDACAEAFLNVPSSEVLADLSRIAQIMGADKLHEAAEQGNLMQRYYDRVFVTASPLYVPLCESCIARGGIDASGVMQYAAVEGSCLDHLLECYGTVGFDYRSLKGFDLAVASLSADSLATELAFLSFCSGREADAWEAGDEAQARHWSKLSHRFAREHAGTWVAKAADCLGATDNDLYAHTCRLAADTIAALKEESS